MEWDDKENRIVLVARSTENCNFNTYCELRTTCKMSQENFTTAWLWWLITISVSFILSVWTVLETYHKWNISPVIISFEQNPTLVYQIPFPAVTVCSSTRIKQTIYNYTENYYNKHNLTEEEYNKFLGVALLCDNSRKLNIDNVTNSNVVDIMSEIAPELEEVISKVSWSASWNVSSGYDENPRDFFTRTLLEAGICYTFNVLKWEEIYTNETYHYKDLLQHDQDPLGWSLERGYQKDVGLDTYPRRVMIASQKVGFSIVLITNKEDMDSMCDGLVEGFKIFLHHPGELPGINAKYIQVPLDTQIRLAIKPDMVKTSVELKSYNPHKRVCYFSTERQLRYFKQYSKNNCEQECLVNFTLANCGCVAYYMPHSEGAPICDTTSCLDRVEKAQVNITSPHDQKYEYVATDSASCDCLPSCTSLTYNVDTLYSDLNWNMTREAHAGDSLTDTSTLRASKVELFFDKNQFTALKRNELYSTTEFIANSGGILGLFTGFTFLSLVEIFYFLTIRWMVNLKMYGRHNWSASEDLIMK